MVSLDTIFDNRLLSSFTREDRLLLLPELALVNLKVRDVLEAPNEPIEAVYFPGPGVLSVVAISDDGEKQEVGVIGPEGMSGLSIVQGSDRSPNETFVQIRCDAYRLSSVALRHALEQSPTLRRSLARYCNAFMIQLSHTTLAGGRYSIEARLARWLLMCQDRLLDDHLAITHEFLSIMLGVRRAGVTTALHLLEGDHVIRATRGAIEVRDRSRLLEIARGSYGIPEREYERLIRQFQPGLVAPPPSLRRRALKSEPASLEPPQA